MRNAKENKQTEKIQDVKIREAFLTYDFQIEALKAGLSRYFKDNKKDN